VLVNGGPVRRESPGSGRHREIPAAQAEDLPAVVSEELKSLKLRADSLVLRQQRPSLFQPDFHPVRITDILGVVRKVIGDVLDGPALFAQ
jgi:hypothetical protein